MPAIPSPTRFPVRVWLISLAGWMFDFYDLVLFSYLLVPIGNDLALTPGQEATLLGVVLGGSGVGGVLFGYLSDRFGRRHVMTWTILVYSVGTGLTGFSTGFWSVLGFRLLTGLGVGGEWAVGHALLAESTPQAMRGRASALLQAGEPMGVGLAAIMGFLVAPVIGWRAVFFVSAASALVAFLVRTHLPRVAALGKPARGAALAGAGPGAAGPSAPGRRHPQRLRAGRAEAGNLLDLLHLAAEVPADRDASAVGPVGDLDADGAAGAVHWHAAVRVPRRSLRPPRCSSRSTRC